jgi:hypothetical protein
MEVVVECLVFVAGMAFGAALTLDWVTRRGAAPFQRRERP